MNFRTEINIDSIEKSSKQIAYTSKIGLIGSCFTENISEKLSYYKFQNWVNPYGILFNPKAIEKALTDIISQKVYTEKDLIFENEHWHSLHHHSDFSDSDVSVILHKINSNIAKTATDLKDTSHLILTLGTAWVYQFTPTNEVVANCHKIPQKQFVKRILSVNEIAGCLQNCIQIAQKINPNIQVILTLSPVRHLKDGMIQNSQSKAHLLSAIHRLIDENNIIYFPSYEIVMDDLRDYRFYKSDMLHPNKTAIDYIWEIFKKVWIAPNSFPIMEQVAQIQKALQHRAFNPNSAQHKLFIEKLKQQEKQLFDKHKIKF